ncbi:MAG: thermonuclease family protein [Candidatus Gottesmanbacteria bacterium]|nr:thermonuclease family protein [Candidatus Gottesmanbacteria bacterium]
MKKQSSFHQSPIHHFFRLFFSSRVLIPILLLFLLLSLTTNAIYFSQSLERMRVVSVPDGDSLQLKDGRRVRLLGLDAPERGRCMASEARDKLVQLALGKRVRLKNMVMEDYGRTLANVVVEDVPTWFGYLATRFHWSDWVIGRIGRININDPLLQRALLAAGLARNRSSSGNPYHQVLKDAQKIAKAGKLGIWSDACRGQMPVSEDCTIKGNTRAGEKYYYVPTCGQYSQVLVDRAYGDAWFCSEEEAKKAGFVQSPVCGK